jgi:hypothetical protein
MSAIRSRLLIGCLGLMSVLALCLTTTPGASATPREIISPHPPRMSVRMTILVDGRPAPTVEHLGKTWLPIPRMGAEYQIRVANYGPRRIAAIVSVDGLSVINGKPASESSPGYLVDAYGSIIIDGWRRNLEKVAAFRFVEREESYAWRMGPPDNIGVIGLVAIKEEGMPPRPWRRLDKGEASKGARSMVGSTGTEYGRDIDSPAYYVPFIRSSNKRSVTIYYDTPEALRKAGVPIPEPGLPIPFPADKDFAHPPPPRNR